MKNWKKTLVHTVALWLLSLAPSMAQSLPDPGNIGTPSSGSSPADPGNTSGTGPLPLTPDPYLRPYAQELSEEQRAAVLENLGLTGGGSGATPSTSATILFHSWDDKNDSVTNDLGLADTGQSWVLNGSGSSRARVLGGRYTQALGSTGGAVYAWPDGSVGLEEPADYYAWATSWEVHEGGSGPATSAFILSPRFGFGVGAENLLHIVYGANAFRVEILTRGLPSVAQGQVNIATLNYVDGLTPGQDHLHELEFLGADTIRVTLGSPFTISSPATGSEIRQLNEKTVILTYPGLDDARAGRFPAWEWIIPSNPALVPGVRWVYAAKKRSVDFEFLSRRSELTGRSTDGSESSSLPRVLTISEMPTSQLAWESEVIDEIHINLSAAEWQETPGFFQARFPSPSEFQEGHEIVFYDISREMSSGDNSTRFVNLLAGSLFNRGWDFVNPNTGIHHRFQGPKMTLRSIGGNWLILE